ncbi:hypothetical protein RND81_05G131400 [Saponaria officinalis]|uniref:Uncharacterized protein n=1 Tax=Saponaria officinalis TaxID=3572 RepID=A0AAW1KY20_SAPOF
MAQTSKSAEVKVIKGKKAFEEEVKEATKKVDASLQLSLVGAAVYNGTGKALHNLETHFWYGTPFSFPDIPDDGGAIVLSLGDYPNGAVYAPVYVDGPGNTARMFFFAVDTSAEKIYAQSGPVGPIDWNVVKVKLGESGSESIYVDPVLGGKVVAKVKGNFAVATFCNNY